MGAYIFVNLSAYMHTRQGAAHINAQVVGSQIPYTTRRVAKNRSPVSPPTGTIAMMIGTRACLPLI